MNGTEWVGTHSWRVCVWLLGWAGQQRTGGEEGRGGGGRSTAPYCQPAVAACEALLTVPSKTHLFAHTHSKMHTKSTHTCEEQVWGYVFFFFFKDPSVLLRRSLVPLVSSRFFSCLLLYVRSPPTCWPPLWKIKEKGGGERRTRHRAQSGRGRVGPCVRMGEKITLCHVVRPIDRPRHGV